MTEKTRCGSLTAAISNNVVRAAHQLRVLVVDDNIDTGRTLCTLLRVKGHETCMAHDGLEAIDRAAEFQPHLVLMDIEMPKLNGYDATRQIRELPNGGEIHIAALTGFTEPHDIKQSREAGCSSHLSKPLDFIALDRLLKSVATGDHPSAGARGSQRQPL